MEMDMDINRIGILMIFLLMITIFFGFLPLSIHAAFRGITV